MFFSAKASVFGFHCEKYFREDTIKYSISIVCNQQ